MKMLDRITQYIRKRNITGDINLSLSRLSRMSYLKYENPYKRADIMLRRLYSKIESARDFNRNALGSPINVESLDDIVDTFHERVQRQNSLGVFDHPDTKKLYTQDK